MARTVVRDGYDYTTIHRGRRRLLVLGGGFNLVGLPGDLASVVRCRSPTYPLCRSGFRWAGIPYPVCQHASFRRARPQTVLILRAPGNDLRGKRRDMK